MKGRRANGLLPIRTLLISQKGSVLNMYDGVQAVLDITEVTPRLRA